LRGVAEAITSIYIFILPALAILLIVPCDAPFIVL